MLPRSGFVQPPLCRPRLVCATRLWNTYALAAWTSVDIKVRAVQIDEFEVHEGALRFLLGDPPLKGARGAKLRCA